MRTSSFAAVLVATVALASPASAQQVTKETVPGVANFARR